MELVTLVSSRPMMDERCYLVLDDGQAVIIDPDSVDDAAEAELAQRGAQLMLILLTHGHFDHIGSVEALHRATGAPVAIHADDAPMLTDARLNLSGYFGAPTAQCPADRLLHDGDLIPISGRCFRVIHTPGHTKGSCCFLLDRWLFSGDTLFAGSVGRTDFPGGSAKALYDSITDRILPLPGGTVVYPGHGESTSLSREKRHNPYISML